MEIIYWISFIVFLFSIGKVASAVVNPSLSEWIITCFILFTGSVVPTGFILSALNLTASTTSWVILNFIILGIHWVVWRKLKPIQAPILILPIFKNRIASLKTWFKELTPYLKFIFGILFATFIVVAITNLILVLFTVPNEWDSMTGHLNRAIRYIQRGTMAHFGGTNWNMDTYPKSVTGIQIYSYLVSGEIENAFKFIHHTAYYITLIAIFGIAQRIGRNISASIFCAISYGFFLDFLMQAVTTETDIVLTAYLTCLLYYLFAFYSSKDNRYLLLTGMVFGLALGHKVTFLLLLPSVFVVMIYTVFLAPNFTIFFKRTLKLGISIVLAVCIYTLPTGYIKNIQVFGHPIGPPTALKHQSVERFGSFSNLLKQGSRNAVRYGYDFFNLDGIRNAQWGYNLNTVIRKPIVYLEDKLNLRLDEETTYAIVPFTFQRKFDYYNANPYWGVFGFALIFPLILLVFFRILSSRVHFFLAIAFLLHYAAISYSAVYDPFKGRYFIETGVFGALFLLLLFSNHRLSILKPRRNIWKGYIALIVTTACVSAIMAVYLNIRCLPFPAYGYESALKMDRMSYQTFARPDITLPYRTFDSIVPANAIVALATINDDFEYPLYGKELTRKLISINPFEQGLRPIPAEADYLFYDKSVINDTSKIKALKSDLRLGTDTTLVELIVKGEDYYLRKLK